MTTTEARPDGSLVNGFLRWHPCGVHNSHERDHAHNLFDVHYCMVYNRCAFPTGTCEQCHGYALTVLPGPAPTSPGADQFSEPDFLNLIF